jgi:hypothetical protein
MVARRFFLREEIVTGYWLLVAGTAAPGERFILLARIF